MANTSKQLFPGHLQQEQNPGFWNPNTRTGYHPKRTHVLQVLAKILLCRPCTVRNTVLKRQVENICRNTGWVGWNRLIDPLRIRLIQQFAIHGYLMISNLNKISWKANDSFEQLTVLSTETYLIGYKANNISSLGSVAFA